nr:putative glutathione S-transferase [uncultured Gammaproteobacteria bacterium]
MTTDNKLVLHQYQVSPFAAKVRRCLHFKGIAFEVINYGMTGVGKVRKLSPAGKAPVLEHNGRMIADSSDIVRHVEENFPDKPLYPGQSRTRALAHMFEDWADESLYYYDLTMRSWPNNAKWLADDLVKEDSGAMQYLFRLLVPKIIRKQARDQGTGRKTSDAVCADVARHFEAINTLVSDNAWLAGESLSIADISVVSMLTVLDRATEARNLMATQPALLHWQQRVDALTLPEGTTDNDRALA